MAFFNSNFMLQLTPQEHDQHHTTPQEFHGVASPSLQGKRQSMSFSTNIEVCEDHTNDNINHGEDELSDDGSIVGEKKRRLNTEQVKTLEENFESCNKLEPEKKIQLAKTLGLQPRQIAIWFQNRRARWKTKQLEKDYDLLKRHFDAVKLENDALLSQNQKLLAEELINKIMELKTREPTESINLNKETEGSCSNRSENNSSEMKFDINNYSSSRNNYPAIESNLSTAINISNNGVAQIHQNGVKEESSSLCNMFCGMDDQAGFWPWLDQQNFN